MAATEHTVAMMMAMTRHIPQAHQSIQEGKWDRKSFDGIQVQGKTLGIIGVGRIGSRVAKRMQAMEMTTIGYDPYITEERAHQVGVVLVDLTLCWLNPTTSPSTLRSPRKLKRC